MLPPGGFELPPGGFELPPGGFEFPPGGSAKARKLHDFQNLPALHQEAITSREEVYENARKLKAKAYPRKDSAGRLLNESFCLPFILTSMGGLCEEGHEFLRLCKRRNKGATMHLLDVLVTQHAKWTAKRIRRGLFGQALVDFSTECWSSIQLQESLSQQTKRQSKKTPRILRNFAQSRILADDDVGMHAKTAKQTGSLSISTGATTNKKVSLSFSTGAATSEKLFQGSDAESVASGSEESDNLK